MSNFIEIEIGGELRAFRFGLQTLGDIQHDLGIDFAGLGICSAVNPFRNIPVILYYGHKFETEEREQIVDFTKRDFSKWLSEVKDTVLNEDIRKVIKVFHESIEGYLPTEKEAEAILKKVDDAPKKKLTGT